jgi:4-hydroxybenzoate polyprenyltransferase
MLGAACHPLPTAAVTALVGAVAAAAGRGVGGTAAVVAAVLAGQLSVGWANDALDAGRDSAVGRTDKPAAGGGITPREVAAAAGLALVLCLPLSLLSGPRAAAAHLVGVVAGGWAYDLGLKRTLWSPLPYAIGFASLPAFVALGLPAHPWPAWWAVTGAALLGVGAHFVNVLPDLADDHATGVAGLPQRLGATRSVVLAGTVLGTALAVIALGPPGAPGAAALTALVTTGTVGLVGVAWLLGFRRRSGRENVAGLPRTSDPAVRTSPPEPSVPSTAERPDGPHGDSSAEYSRAVAGLPFRAAILVAAVAVALLVARGGAIA